MNLCDFESLWFKYFCVLNPDIRLDKSDENIFLILTEKLKKDQNIGIIAPIIIDEKNNVQDSARKFLNLTESQTHD